MGFNNLRENKLTSLNRKKKSENQNQASSPCIHTLGKTNETKL